MSRPNSRTASAAPLRGRRTLRLLIAFGLVTSFGLAGCGSDGANPDQDLGVLDDLGPTPDEGTPVDNGVCVDDDEDGYGVDCTLGLDCDDADPNNWTSCATCVDEDADRAFTGCDAYTDIAGPDCDDEDAAISPLAAELADDGTDNDCADGDLVALTATAGTYVALVSGCSDTSPTRGSRVEPACTLEGALSRTTHGDFFVESRTQTVASAGFSGGDVRLYGGYAATNWSRDVEDEPTRIHVTSDTLGAPMITFTGGDSFVIDGFEVRGTPVGAGDPERSAFELTPAVRAAFHRVGIETTGLIGAIHVTGSASVHPDLTILQSRVLCADSALATSSVLSCVRADDLDHALLAFSTFRSSTVGRNLQVITFQQTRDIALLNNALQGRSVDSSSRIVVANGPELIRAVSNSVSIQSASNSYAGVFELGEVDAMMFLNNATYGQSAQTVWLFENSETLGTLVARNNHFHESGTPAMAFFAQRFNRGTVTPYNSASATDFNTCTQQCQDVGGNFAGDPLFVDHAAADFALQGGSPLIDAGVDATTLTTLPGLAFSFSASRPQGSAWDVGAYEIAQ